MLRVEIVRDDVAMGDERKTALWEFPDDAVFGEVVLRTLQTGFLARVAAYVAWVLRSEHDFRAIVVLQVPDRGDPTVTTLAHRSPRSLLSDFPRDDDGILRLHWEYQTGGRPMPWDEYRSTASMTHEEWAARTRQIWAERDERLLRRFGKAYGGNPPGLMLPRPASGADAGPPVG